MISREGTVMAHFNVKEFLEHNYAETCHFIHCVSVARSHILVMFDNQDEDGTSLEWFSLDDFILASQV